MPTDDENLTTARSNLTAALAEITANPKPNYNIDGQMIAWGDYLKQLMDGIKAIDEQLAGSEPFEIVTRGTC